MSDKPQRRSTPKQHDRRRQEQRMFWRALTEAAARYDWIGPELVRLTGREIPTHPTEWLALAAEYGYQGGYDADLIALHVIGKLRAEARQAAQQISVQPTAKTSKLAYALAVLTDHPDWTNESIAGVVGCNVKYLSQAPKFKAARTAIQGLGQERRTRDRRSRGADVDGYADGD